MNTSEVKTKDPLIEWLDGMERNGIELKAQLAIVGGMFLSDNEERRQFAEKKVRQWLDELATDDEAAETCFQSGFNREPWLAGYLSRELD